ncbi:redoxin domain-containing protein [Mycobacterium botniense]|uniref:redoxin domain-containing protein n=1 Tax=Mycobacterium botniense TaxID=84962 RepID=UPI001FE44730|nr:redoxin domain-containing protein [Mycobacterium botniense]
MAAAALLLAGCGWSHTTAPAPVQLQFSAKTLAGQPFSGESLRGKPSVLWFWAPWCPQCQQEASTVAKVAAANPAVTFVGVAGHDRIPAMQAFVDKYRLGGFTQLADTDGTIWARFGVTHQPAYAFVSSHGSVDVVKSSLRESQLSERVHALVTQ